jgi:hypothetical protein
VAIKVTGGPDMTAGAADPVWMQARPPSFQLSDGVNFANGKGETTGALGAVYTADMLRMLIQYQDPTNSVRRGPHQKQADGSRRPLKDPQYKGGDDNVYYEDK